MTGRMKNMVIDIGSALKYEGFQLPIEGQIESGRLKDGVCLASPLYLQGSFTHIGENTGLLRLDVQAELLVSCNRCLDRKSVV